MLTGLLCLPAPPVSSPRQIQASTCVSSVHSTHIREALLTPTHLALVLDFEAGGSAAEFVAQQVRGAGRW